MRRRAVLALPIGLLAPGVTAFAQAARPYRIGFLSPADGPGENHQAFLDRLASLGYRDGVNIAIIWKWLHQAYDELPANAVDLVRQSCDLIVAQTQAAALAARTATRSIPIVFVGVRDPVAAGLVTSLAQPGDNITGVTLTSSEEIAAKQIELLKSVTRHLTDVGIVWNPRVLVQAQAVSAITTSVRSMNVTMHSFEVQRDGDLERAFSQMSDQSVRAFMTLVESFTLQRRKTVADLGIQYGIASAFEVRSYVDAGGLLSYGVSYRDHYARSADYVAKIIKGARPGEIPIEQPSHFELVLNMDSAKKLHLDVPSDILALADDVIEH